MSRGSVIVAKVDLLVIGGGITGAGIALEGARRGFEVLLVEARDFAAGTSSRSSKLIHGGLRYLSHGQLAVTREAVRERRRLLLDAPGLVEPQRFLMAHYAGRAPGRLAMHLGLALYDWLGGTRTRSFHSRAECLTLAPHAARADLIGGSSYLDAKTDDARLVLRVLQEARGLGARTCNYVAVRELLRDAQGVCGARLSSTDTGTADSAHAGTSSAPIDVHARCVVNATGVWADTLRTQLGVHPKLRPLRGSHLLLPLWRLPVAHAISLMHPRDGRPVFAYPWEGVALVGTTDLDHAAALDEEPRITPEEVTYLLEALHFAFPRLDLSARDVLATFAGVRPVLAGGAAEPSKETRDFAIVAEQGLVTVMGGKLTTFRAIAHEALRRVAARLPPSAGKVVASGADVIFAPTPPSARLAGVPAWLRSRLQGRYGHSADAVIACAGPSELERVPGTLTLWAELRWAARAEAVQHLDDLLLRRTRLGLLCRGGAAEWLPHVKPIAQQELNWGEQRWNAECERYLSIIESCYSLPAELRSRDNRGARTVQAQEPSPRPAGT